MKRVLSATVLLLTAVLVFQVTSSRTDRSEQGEITPAPVAQTVYIDPRTGEFSEPPPGTPALPLDAKSLEALSTSGEGLTEVASPVPGGGTMIRLNGRFRSTTFAGSDGHAVSTRCGHPGDPAESTAVSSRGKEDSP